MPGVDYSDQLIRKQARLASWFPDVARAQVVASPSESGFRHKVAFVFASSGASGHALVMGHYQAHSRRVVPVQECPVHSDLGNRLAFALRDRLAASRVPPGVLRHVIVRTADNGREAVMMLVVTVNHKALRAPVRAFLDDPEAPGGFFLNVHDRPDAYMVGRETIRLAGRSHVREEVLGTSFLISPTTFFQTNVQAARVLLRLVLDHVGAVDRVLDLYSGSGLFALPLAQRGCRVVAIEENRQAVKDAEANVRLNQLPAGAVRFVTARVEDALARMGRERFDAVVLDPPRQGCPDAVIDRVCALAPPRIVYVSCNPEKLAVEQRRFGQHGYRITELQGVDMFPHTEHIETVSMFTRPSGRPS